MKKTIAKIMAAAMVLSSLSVPQVANAAIYNYSATGGIRIANLKIGNVDLWINGVEQDNEMELGLTDDEIVKMMDSTAATYDPTDSAYTFAGVAGGQAKVETAEVYTGVAVAKNTEISKENAVTKGTTSAQDTWVKTDVTDTYDSIDDLLYANYKGDASKVTVNGEYNDLINADNTSNWVWMMRGADGIFRPRFNRRDARFDEWMAKLRTGAVLRVSVLFRNPANRILWRRTIRIFDTTTGTTTDDYWNGIVKLKSSNNRYTPIRVHIDTNDKSLAGANLGLFTQIVNGTNVVGLGVGTRALPIQSLSNLRLELLDVNEYDLAILKSDYAKGKNLMLDKVYVFSTTDPRNDNGFYSAWTGYEDFFNLGVDTDLGTTSIGKIDKIHARLFKECKMKYVDAQNAKFINNGAFRKCKQLKKARIGDEKNMKKINEKAFYDCKKLATVKLSGKTLKRVGKDAFKKCKNNILFKIKGNNNQVKKAAKMLLKQAPSKARYAKI